MAVVKDILKENGKILLLAVGILVVSIVGLLFLNQSNLTSNIMDDNTNNNLPNYTATIKTNMGDIEIDLFEKETPKTVENFVKLSKEGFYNGLIFHRVVKDFVIQGGDPEGTGRGGPGYQFDDEITERKYTKYSLGMANAGPNTNGSQFFITVGSIQDVNLRNLDGKYTLFGIVTSGKDVVDKIAVVNVDENDKPLTPVKMESITIHES
ncbi:MAG TPA: peptidylprolyl isomerase [Candidatus Dojkabacteria bacterium]|jgi:cyclophilin family peptidyl-prolyl cis-trans isomerase|nr:peptidylprolyl isomerase [Candidatus Dojkabacteria bacterium]